MLKKSFLAKRWVSRCIILILNLYLFRHNIPIFHIEDSNFHEDVTESTSGLNTADHDFIHPPRNVENRSCNNEASVWGRLNERKRFYPTDTVMSSSNQLTPKLSASANDVSQLTSETEVASNTLKPQTSSKSDSMVFRRRIFGVLSEIKHYVKKVSCDKYMNYAAKRAIVRCFHF